MLESTTHIDDANEGAVEKVFETYEPKIKKLELKNEDHENRLSAVKAEQQNVVNKQFEIELISTEEKYRAGIEYLKLKQDLQQYLVDVYQMHYVKTWISPFTTQQEDVVNIDDVYVSPRMVVEEKEHGNVGNTTKNGEVRETNNMLIERYRDLFHTREKRNRKIFVVGDKGTGKSSFCKMMIQNWCSAITKRGDPGVKDINKMIQGEEYNRCDMSQFDFLFHISLCEMPHDIYDTDDMIKAQWNNYRNEVDDIFTNDSERILILVDGLDEWTPSKRKRQSLLGIPTSRFARDSTVLTTSRPSSRGILNLKSSDYDLKVTLFGLRKSSVQPMIEKYMQVLNKTSAVKTFSDTLSSLPIKDIHNAPLLLQKIVWLYCKYHDTGQSFYDHIMNAVREWECDKQVAFPTQQSSNLENFQLEKPFENLASAQNNRQLLLPTGKIAYFTLHT
ncbi:uncharacterized protein LOC128554824 [Mercenaria mercenaria]|uniref:uncharacterized protein LOC128554824 n=1 Tax=Mercenaria mercenaria TaxID=6596 RepID=UPI00234E6578|nr:uncharacterized protein LOC128554824 [Mercenaria mercenaria]